MACSAPVRHDGCMNDTQESPPPTGPDDEFDASRLRTIFDVKRSADDRIVAGVCAGVAKYLRIDPVIVRIVIAVLTLVGFAGAILYAAAWLLLPSEDTERSVAAGWFKIDENEEQVRKVGLVAAGVIAVFSILGGNDHWWGIGWILIPLGALYYLFVVRPRKVDTDVARAQALADVPTGEKIAADVQAKIDDKIAERVAHARQPKSKALTVLTLSLITIGVAATRIYADLNDDDVRWTTYVAVALAITGAGLVIGTFFGYGGPLIALGLALGLALAVGSVLPNGRIGAQQPTPSSAADVHANYKHGIGLLELDLTGVSDTTELLGRTIVLDAGIGQTKVIVPEGLNVEIDSELKLGEIRVFGRIVHGTDNELNAAATEQGSALTIEIDQKIGNVEVVRS